MKSLWLYGGFALLGLLQAGDVISTWLVMSAGGRELNRPMAALMAKIGVLPASILVKVVTFGVLALAVFWFLPGHPYWAWVIAALDVVYIGVLINNALAWRRQQGVNRGVQ
ncbi:MAG: DUF5658 family protein [Burkholderiaceae bacterium]|jgi:hypothetical protein|nr:DUF5658 family protein [Burkholderiaceae bacterium]